MYMFIFLIDQLRRDVNNDLDAMKQRQQPTWQERQSSRPHRGDGMIGPEFGKNWFPDNH